RRIRADRNVSPCRRSGNGGSGAPKPPAARYPRPRPRPAATSWSGTRRQPTQLRAQGKAFWAKILSSGATQTAAAAVAQAFLAEQRSELFGHRAGEFLGIDDGDGAAVITRDVVADADGEQF